MESSRDYANTKPATMVSQMFSCTRMSLTKVAIVHAGECKPIVADYLRCLRRLRGINDVECRMMAKDYLKCRMDQYVLHIPFAPIGPILWGTSANSSTTQ